MLHVSLLGWLLTVGVVAALFGADLLMSWRRPRAASIRGALHSVIFYVVISVLFGAVIAVIGSRQAAAQYFSVYLLEKSLSLDNLLVFTLILAYFAVPRDLEPHALTLGIGVALLLRVLFIGLGIGLIDTLSATFLIFGIALLVASVQLARHSGAQGTIQDSRLIRLLQRFVPVSTAYSGSRLITSEGGRRVLTPLMLVTLTLATTDLVFAFDSIPAAFGVTQQFYIICAANAFALLGLRPLYFVVTMVLDRVSALQKGLALVLGFISVKLIMRFLHLQDPSIPEISTAVTLAVIATVLTLAATACHLSTPFRVVRRAISRNME